MKKKKEWILQQSNMRECFLRLVRRLNHTSFFQLPKKDEKFFKSFAESMRVDPECFNCHAVSFAVVRQEPDLSKEQKVYLAALELHAMNGRLFMDLSVPIFIGHQKDVDDYLNRDEQELVDELIKAFEQLNSSFR